MQVTGADADLIARATPLVQERMATLREAADMLQFLVGGGVFAVDPEAAAKQLGAEQLAGAGRGA